MERKFSDSLFQKYSQYYPIHRENLILIVKWMRKRKKNNVSHYVIRSHIFKYSDWIHIYFFFCQLLIGGWQLWNESLSFYSFIIYTLFYNLFIYWHVWSSWTKHWTYVSCTGKQIFFYCWATRKALLSIFLISLFVVYTIIPSFSGFLFHHNIYALFLCLF